MDVSANKHTEHTKVKVRRELPDVFSCDLL